MAKYKALGATLAADFGGTGDFTVTAQVMSISRIAVSRKTFDITDTVSQQSDIREYVLGTQRTVEPFSLLLAYDLDNTQHRTFRDKLFHVASLTEPELTPVTYRTSLGGGADEEWEFTAFVTEIALQDRPVDGRLLMQVTFQPISVPELVSEPSITSVSILYNLQAEDYEEANSSWIDRENSLEFTKTGIVTKVTNWDGTGLPAVNFSDLSTAKYFTRAGFDRYLQDKGITVALVFDYTYQGNDAVGWSPWSVFDPLDAVDGNFRIGQFNHTSFGLRTRRELNGSYDSIALVDSDLGGEVDAPDGIPAFSKIVVVLKKPISNGYFTAYGDNGFVKIGGSTAIASTEDATTHRIGRSWPTTETDSTQHHGNIAALITWDGVATDSEVDAEALRLATKYRIV